ncbi:methyltransferase domain-containing protein [Thermoflavimicrobium dichotomicum]|uniref:Tellurite methyltransferase n=1 Tax=Thermoflavimicrobium dichotomicum TaxID=46223 RepID=A0A1I3P1N9_9BACL|nr:methyltransferase domain-containing protein [Thermoflavimicrobium dichotomicum]SFJ15210.1 tellurite methyltransferase [Thermoflavimicrobium dichotomicum]
MDREQLQALYEQEEYYWGKQPNRLAKRVFEFISKDKAKGLKLVDLGAGEGRDSVYFAEQGLDVLAVDISSAGLMKTLRLAEQKNVSVSVQEADLNSLCLENSIDILYSIGALQYLVPHNRFKQFQHFKERTVSGGLHVLFAFIEHPDIEIAPDWGRNEYLYQRDELQEYYRDWKVLDCDEWIFDCHSSGIPHQHAANVLIARKP